MTSRTLSPFDRQTLAQPPVRRRVRLPILALAVVFLTVLIVELTVKPSSFADYAAYLGIADGLKAEDPVRWFDFEPLSSGFIYALRVWTGDAVSAMDIAYYILAGIFAISTVYIVREYSSRWEAVLVFFSMFGPLLAFVTVRATPAYFLVALATLRARRGKVLESLILLALASLFHLSALLAAAPLAVCIVQNRFGALTWFNRQSTVIVWSAIIYGLLLVLFRDTLIAEMLKTVDYMPSILGKYLVYISAADNTSEVQSAGASAFHLIYWVVVSIFMLLFVTVDDKRSRGFKGYIVTSYLLFVILLFSPVSAYRQSIFWMLPGILIFPWRRIDKGVLARLALIIGCVGLFIVGYIKVLA